MTDRQGAGNGGRDCRSGPRARGPRRASAAVAMLLVPLLGVMALPAAAQPAPGAAPGAQASGAPAEADRIVASVEGHQIRLSDLARAAQTLPENLRALPFSTLYPALLDRVVDHEVLVRMARRKGLEDNPAVRRDIDAAVERVLEAAYIAQEAMPLVTEQAIQTRYAELYGSRSATEEARARHILLTTEAEAKDVLAQLAKGADFATLARTLSKDPDSQRGGDLGFFRREQVWPGFADVAFTLPPGQVAPAPIHNEFGWHVIKVEERRLVAPPTLADVRDALRQDMITEAVQQLVRVGRSQLVVRQFNLDGSQSGGSLTLPTPR